MTRYANVASYRVIYCFTINDENHRGQIKVGKTSFASHSSYKQLTPNCEEIQKAARNRINQETKTARVRYELLYCQLADFTIQMEDGTVQHKSYTDDDIHMVLKNSGYPAITFNDFEEGNDKDSEWFEVDLETVLDAIHAFENGHRQIPNEIVSDPVYDSKIVLRKEQEKCVKKTMSVFKEKDTMLWDCKMRFGKTVTAYKLIQEAKYRKVIIITHRPAVEDSWDTDFYKMFDGSNYEFLDKTKGTLETFDEVRDSENDRILLEKSDLNIPFIYFASVQDLRGSNRVGGKHNKNNVVFDMDWDLIIVDEAHEGIEDNLGEDVVNLLKKEKTKALYLTGTAYKLFDNFDDDNTYTWTYVDEQKAKKEWPKKHPGESNPYESLPVMNILTFDISNVLKDSYRFVSPDAAFNFIEFFRTWTGDLSMDFYPIPQGKQIGDFVHEESVIDFLNLISKQDENSNYPFSNEDYIEMFAHTFWIVPGVKEALALSNLLKRHPFFKHYKVVNVAGEGNREEPHDKALPEVRKAIRENERTITISCGRLTTGVTVGEWTGIMMLSGSAETSVSGYMQAIFRVQSPCVINGKLKENCYVFDFAPDRALIVTSKAHRLSKKRKDEETYRRELGEFINFCPIISVEGTEMKRYDVSAMMRQVKKLSVSNAIKNGFDDDSIYRDDAGIVRTAVDDDILMRLSDVVDPQKKRKNKNKIPINNQGMTAEEHKAALDAHKKKSQHKELSPEEKAALEKEKEQKKEQKKLFDLLRAVSIRLPLLFYGAEQDITEIIKLEDFVDIVDDESWEEYMPQGLKKSLFKELLRYYDEDVVTGAGLRIRKLAKQADEYPPTERVKMITDIISKFKNPDKETVLTPWKVVNMHLGETIGGYNFFNEDYSEELDEPRLIEREDITENILLNENVKILELNSKSGLYPLYMAFSLYNLYLTGTEQDKSLESLQGIWNRILENNIFVLCKTKMAVSITKRTLAGYTSAKVNAKYLPHLIENMKEEPKRIINKLTYPGTWGIELMEGERMKFDAVVGNPPYQGTNHQQLYPYFYTTAINVGSIVSLIFPTGWQEPKNANGLAVLNKPEIKEDEQIIFIDNRENVFPGISGAEWTNFILWKKDYDNQLNGNQLVKTNGADPKIVHLNVNTKVEKPAQLSTLSQCVKDYGGFESMQNITSVLKPYGLRTDVLDNPKKYNLNSELIYQTRHNSTDYLVYCKNKKIVFMDNKLTLPKQSKALEKYKVFVAYAWGNMSENCGLGGAYSDIIIASPHEICLETYLESGLFDDFETARKHAKYLMTRFTRALLYINKFSQHSTTAWGDIPVQDYHEEWWNKSIAEIDEELFKKYNVPDDIAQFVRENIQIKTEANIVNFAAESKG